MAAKRNLFQVKAQTRNYLNGNHHNHNNNFPATHMFASVCKG